MIPLACLLGFSILLCLQMDSAMGDGGSTDIGVNWGTQSSHNLPPATVVKMLEDNRMKRVRVFDTEPLIMEALSGSSIRVFTGIPNEMLKTLATSKKAACSWVHENVTRYASKGGVDIRYIAIGNDPFLKNYSGHFQSYVLPAAVSIQRALQEAELPSKVVVPCSTDVYQNKSKLPSKTVFRSDLNKTMHQLVSFLNKTASPFVINVSPFVDFHDQKNLSTGLAFFQNSSHPLVDGKNVYYNDFDRNLDMLESSLQKMGFSQMPIIIGEIGWPTDGAYNATPANAAKFMKGLVSRIESGNGTPLRQGNPPIEVYLKSLLDEDQQSIATGNFERHFGLFTFDGQAKYKLNLGQLSGELVNAQNVQYLSPRWCVANDNNELSNVSTHVDMACLIADCTALWNGGSCNQITYPGNISYAFNSYYQFYNQSVEKCHFDGLGMITTVDPSIGDCRFLVAVNDSFASSLVKSTLQHLVFQLMMLIAYSQLFLFGFSK